MIANTHPSPATATGQQASDCYWVASSERYSSIPGNRNWQIETADWNLDVRLDILGLGVKKLYASLEILLRNWLAGSKPVVSISRDATVVPESRRKYWVAST